MQKLMGIKQIKHSASAAKLHAPTVEKIITMTKEPNHIQFLKECYVEQCRLCCYVLCMLLFEHTSTTNDGSAATLSQCLIYKCMSTSALV